MCLFYLSFPLAKSCDDSPTRVRTSRRKTESFGRLLVAVALGLGLVALGVGCSSPVFVHFLFSGVNAWKRHEKGLR